MLFEIGVHLFKQVFYRHIYSLVVFALFLLFIVWYYNKVGRKAYYLRNFPGTPTEPFLGNLSGLMNGVYGIYGIKEDVTSLILEGSIGFAKVIFRKEKMYVYWQGWEPMINLFTPEAVEAVLSSNIEIEKSRNYNYLHAWLGRGLLTSTGDRWRSKRKLLTPAFHFRILDDFLPIKNDHSMSLVKHLRDTSEQIVDIVPYITRCTLDIISETAMGVKIGAQNNPHSEYVRAVYYVSEMFIYRNIYFVGWFDFLFYRTAAGKKYLSELKILHDFTRNVVRERKKEITSKSDYFAIINGEKENLGIKKRLVFLDLLVEQHLLSETSLTEEDIREEVDTFMFEGHDTTAMAISWTLHLIGLYPDIQQKIHSELDAIFGDDRSQPITNKELNQLKYLECCIKESLRLFPSVPAIARYVKNDFKLDKYTIPRGSTLLIWTYILHRNEEMFPQPEVYNPDRFLPENAARLHPYAYVPFSAGPRNCIGQRFALSEEKIVLANILRNFSITSVDQRDKMIPVVELVTRPKNPIRMRFRTRQKT